MRTMPVRAERCEPTQQENLASILAQSKHEVTTRRRKAEAASAGDVEHWMMTEEVGLVGDEYGVKEILAAPNSTYIAF